MKNIIATKDDAGRTLFKLIENYFKTLPASFIYKLFRNKDIKVNGKRINDSRYKVKEGDDIVVYVKEDMSFREHETFKLKLAVIYEDDNILIVNKPKNLVVHGDTKSLDNAVKTYLRYQPTDSFVPSHIGRLDKETTGLIIYAKNYKTLTNLNVNQSEIKKIYTFVSNNTYFKKEYDLNINKSEQLQKMVVSTAKNSLQTKTILWTEKEKNFAEIITGKKHQIRVLLASLNDPILGDRKYGGRMRERLFLHCYKLVFDQMKAHLSYLNKKSFISTPEWWGNNDRN